MSSIQPKKRKVVDLETKYNALKEVSLGKKSKQAIAQEAGVPPCTLSHWIKDRLKIEDAFTQSKYGPKRKRMKTSRWEDLDEAVDIWLREKRSKNVHISGTLLQETARDLAAKMGIEDFKGGNGWLSGFKERKGLSLRTIQGEAKSVNMDSVESWKSTVLADLLRTYGPDCIYNADETGLYYKAQPSKSLTYKNEDARGAKRSKERITLLLAANMSGSDKLKPLVINKSKTPRAFTRARVRAAQLPVEWEANPSAWMTSEIFSRWLHNQDRRFQRLGKKIALVLDNASSHPHTLQTHCKAIKLIFLPPNTTSVVQPMDQGIIADFKKKFRKVYVQKYLCTDTEWNILTACHEVAETWSLVSPQTIANSFKHCGFVARALPSDEFDEEDEEPLARWLERHMQVSREQAEAFVSIDDNVETSAPLGLDGIIQSVRRDEPIDDEEEPEEAEAISHKDMINAINMLKFNMCSWSIPCDEARACLRVYEATYEKNRISNAKQTSITTFFK